MYIIDYKYVNNEKRQKQQKILFLKKKDIKMSFWAEIINRKEISPKIENMKKLILTPQKDTVTICLPQEWVGKPLVCVLRHPEEKGTYPPESEFVSEVREESIGYLASRYRKTRKPRKKRLRKN